MTNYKKVRRKKERTERNVLIQHLKKILLFVCRLYLKILANFGTENLHIQDMLCVLVYIYMCVFVYQYVYLCANMCVFVCAKTQCKVRRKPKNCCKSTNFPSNLSYNNLKKKEFRRRVFGGRGLLYAST